MARLYWLALGTFDTGTEGFMIAPLLPDLARDFSVSLVAAGQLVTVFSLTYALSSPILTALTGDIPRSRSRMCPGPASTAVPSSGVRGSASSWDSPSK